MKSLNMKYKFNLKSISIFLITSLLLNQSVLLAQTPSTGIFFQAIARDQFANPAKDRKIYVQSSIIQTSAVGTKVLIEYIKLLLTDLVFLALALDRVIEQVVPLLT